MYRDKLDLLREGIYYSWSCWPTYLKCILSDLGYKGISGLCKSTSCNDCSISSKLKVKEVPKPEETVYEADKQKM